MKKLLLLLLLLGCSRSEVINEPPRECVDTAVMMRKPRPPKDTTEKRIPIGFGVTVEDWEEIDINL